MFRWLADASTPEPAPKTVELSRFRSYRRIRSSILIGLLDGTIIARLGQLDFHTAFALERLGVRSCHALPGKVAREPFIPMAVVVLFKTGIGNEVAVQQRKNGKGS